MTPSDARATGPSAPARPALLAALLVASWQPVLWGGDVIARVVALRGAPGDHRPWLETEAPWLPYAAAPLVLLSAFLFVLSPGLLLATALGVRPRIDRMLPASIALSFAVLYPLTQAVQAIVGAPLVGGAFHAVVAGAAAAAGIAVWLRSRSGWSAELPRLDRGTAVAFALVAGPLVLLHGALVPKIYWENFAGDGAGAYEAARLLLHQPVPFYRPEAAMGAPAFNSAANPIMAAFFLRLFGDVEAAARVHFLLALAVVYAVLVALIEHGRSAVLATADRAILWVALTAFAFATAYSATYDPYSADLAMPSAADVLHLAFVLAFVLAFLRGQRAAMVVHLVLTYASSAGGLLLAALWCGAALAALRPRPWRDAFLCGGAAIACVAASAVLPAVLRSAGLPAPGSEHGITNLLRRVSVVQFDDVSRIAFTAVPCGFLPIVAALAWRGNDRTARSIALFWFAAFAWFFVQATTNLHYFVPVMVLPLAVLWRRDPATLPGGPVAARAVVAVGAAAGLVLSLPASWAVPFEGRAIASTIDLREPGYDTCDPRSERRSRLLLHLFPADWDPRAPAETYAGSPRAWRYYARHSSLPSEGRNYVLQLATDPPPPGAALVATDEDAALYVRDRAVWERHLAVRPPTPAGAAVYHLSRDAMFYERVRRVPGVIDLRRFVRSRGPDEDR